MQTPLLRFLEMESMGTKISFATYTILDFIKPKIFVHKRLRMDRATEVSYIRTFMFFFFYLNTIKDWKEPIVCPSSIFDIDDYSLNNVTVSYSMLDSGSANSRQAK